MFNLLIIKSKQPAQWTSAHLLQKYNHMIQIFQRYKNIGKERLCIGKRIKFLMENILQSIHQMSSPVGRKSQVPSVGITLPITMLP